MTRAATSRNAGEERPVGVLLRVASCATLRGPTCRPATGADMFASAREVAEMMGDVATVHGGQHGDGPIRTRAFEGAIER
jgi:hypothetical protein